MSNWVSVASKYGTEQFVRTLVEFNGQLYGGTYGTSLLLQWNGSNAWTRVAPRDLSNIGANKIIVFNNILYAAIDRYFYRWNGSNAWTYVATVPSSQYIYDMAVFNNVLYAGIGNGLLRQFNGTNFSTQSAPKLNSETSIRSLVVYNGNLYGGTYPNGNLFQWNGSNAWVQVAPKLNSETSIDALAVYNGHLYGATSPNGNLFQWNDSNAWVQVAPKLNSETGMSSLVIYNGGLYGTGSGTLLQWNDSNAWVQVASQLNSETGLYSGCVFNSKLYVGTYPNSNLFKYNDIVIDSSSSSSSREYSTSSSTSDSSSSSSSSSRGYSSSSYSSDSSSSLSSDSSSSSSGDIIKLYLDGSFTYIQGYTYVQFRYMDGNLTFATIVLGTTPFLVGNYGNQLVWDYGGEGQYVFENIGDSISITVGTRTYTIEFLGYGSFWFDISAVENRNKSIPFILEVEKKNIIWTMASSGQDVYAGTGSDGILLKSKDRMFWSELFNVDDVHIKALYVSDNKLYIGTAPQGKIYIMDIATELPLLSQQLGGTIYGFIYYRSQLYAAGGNPTNIYVYNSYKNRWDISYTPYSNVITKMLIFNDKLFVFFDDQNFVSFDGNIWTLQKSGVDNISSISNVNMEPYSEVNNKTLTRANVRSVTLNSLFQDEEIYDIFPAHYSRGIKSADVDGGALVIGSSGYGRIYNYFSDNIGQSFLFPVFQTESNNDVNYLLNLAIGVNLAAIDNKLYLIHCGSIATTTSTTTTAIPTETTSTTTVMSTVSVITPIKGQEVIIGDTINITWISSKSVNDAVRIVLYLGDILSQTIIDKTTNDGIYEWQIPNDLLPSTNYKIVVTWLSSTVVQDKANSGESQNFSILLTLSATTTSTTTLPSAADLGLPQSDDCRGIPLLELPEDEYITFMMKDAAKGGVLISTSQGRILGCNSASINAYLTGERNVFAEVKNGFGNVSNTVWTSLFYSLYNKIVEINADKEVVKWKYQVKSIASKVERITGVFLSPVLYVENDLDFWKQLIWNEVKEDDTEITICIRSADTAEALKLMSWDYCFISRDSDSDYGSSTTGQIIRELSEYQIKGKYLQFRVIMTSDKRNISPTLLNITISYSTKFATYFYTTKFELKNESLVKSGFITANMTVPQHTEVKFGISSNNSSNWEDYTVVSPNKLFELNSLDNLKIGIKMITYDENVPEIAEFALLTGSEKDNKINEL